jgi:hypothetical protein
VCRPVGRWAAPSPGSRPGWRDRWRTPTRWRSRHSAAGTAATPRRLHDRRRRRRNDRRSTPGRRPARASAPAGVRAAADATTSWSTREWAWASGPSSLIGCRIVPSRPWGRWKEVRWAGGTPKSPLLVTLTASQRTALKAQARRPTGEYREVLGPGSCWPPRRGGPTPRSPGGSGSRSTPCASGAGASVRRIWRGWLTGCGLAVHGPTRRRWSSRSKRSPASCRRPEVCRLAAGASPSCATR